MAEFDRYYSIGGLGDAYIVLMKILQRETSRQVIWRHHVGHSCYAHNVKELQGLCNWLHGFCVVSPQNELMEIAKKDEDEGFLKIETTVPDIENPYIVGSLIENRVQQRMHVDEMAPSKATYCVVQPAAGRPTDGSHRSVSDDFIKSLASEIKVVLIGGPHDLSGDNIVNLCGQTSLWESLRLIYNSQGTVAQDGFVAYASMSMGLPTIINWHDARLPGHYMHPRWMSHTTELFHGSVMRGKIHLAT